MILSSCGTASKGPPPPLPTTDQAAPKAADPRVCAKAPAEPAASAGASIVQPVGPAEQVATELWLGWVREWIEWGREGWARAEVARAACPAG